MILLRVLSRSIVPEAYKIPENVRLIDDFLFIEMYKYCYVHSSRNFEEDETKEKFWMSKYTPLRRNQAT